MIDSMAACAGSWDHSSRRTRSYIELHQAGLPALAGDLELEGPVLGDVLVHLEEEHRAADRAVGGDRVRFGDLAAGLDAGRLLVLGSGRLGVLRVAGKRQGEGALALDRLLLVPRRVHHAEVLGKLPRLLALVLDGQKDPEVRLPGGREILSPEVSLILGIARIEEAGDLDVVTQLAELERLSLDDLELLLRATPSDGRKRCGNQEEREKPDRR